MIEFNKQDWDTRFAVMGDPAETAFGRLCEYNQWPYKRMGLDKVPFDVRGIPSVIRFMPDFLIQKGLDGVTWIECMGTGRLDSVKLKVSKRDSLRSNFLYSPRLEFFVYNAGRYQRLEGQYLIFLSLGCDVKRFHDGNEYVEVPLDDRLWQNLP